MSSGQGQTVGTASSRPFNGVKIFSATMSLERQALGERLTAWLHANPGVEVVETVITQSSDSAFHCLAITLFFWEPRH